MPSLPNPNRLSRKISEVERTQSRPSDLGTSYHRSLLKTPTSKAQRLRELRLVRAISVLPIPPPKPGNDLSPRVERSPPLLSALGNRCLPIYPIQTTRIRTKRARRDRDISHEISHPHSTRSHEPRALSRAPRALTRLARSHDSRALAPRAARAPLSLSRLTTSTRHGPLNRTTTHRSHIYTLFTHFIHAYRHRSHTFVHTFTVRTQIHTAYARCAHTHSPLTRIRRTHTYTSLTHPVHTNTYIRRSR